MSKAQHTPGPWSLVNTPNDPDFSNEIIGIAAIYRRHGENGDGKSNARLIAAVPELLELAQLALVYIDSIPKDAILPAMPGFDRDWADNVIAKAKEE